MLRPWFVLALAALFALDLAFGVAACGPAPASSSTTSPVGSISHPTGATDVVLRVSAGGGMMRPEYDFTRQPEFTLYGDGRIIVFIPGPITEESLASLPNLQTTVVSEEVTQSILAGAREVKLFQNGVDYGEPAMTDQDTTTIKINADGTTYYSYIYALGFDPEEGVSVSMEQQQARDAIDGFRGKLSDLGRFGAPQLTWEPYDFTALKVFSRPPDTGPTDIRSNHLRWPLADLATSGTRVGGGLRMSVVTGDDLATLKPLLPQATQLTLWQSGSASYNIWLRPLLPDEAAAS